MTQTPDLNAYWMPFTANRYFKSHPVMLAGAEGMYYRTADGREVLDGIAGLWCCNAGHCHPRVVAALREPAPTALFVQCTRYDLCAAALDPLVEALGTVDGPTVPGVYANDGREWKDLAWHGERVPPEEYADTAVTWVGLGARIVGGCCGTDPTHVAALTARFKT